MDFPTLGMDVSAEGGIRPQAHGRPRAVERAVQVCSVDDRITNYRGLRRRSCQSLLLLVGVLAGFAFARSEPTVDELKARVSSANVADKAKICVQIAEKQLAEADKEYSATEIEKAQSSLSDAVAYAELARDYSIQSRKHQKQTEIAVRTMTRKLNDLLHVLTRDDQAPVRDAIRRLERVRDDLLAAMFPKGSK